MNALLAFASDHVVISTAALAVTLGLIGKVLVPMLATCQDIIDSFFRTAIKMVVVNKTVSEAQTQQVVYFYLNHKARGYGNLDDQYEMMYDHIKPLDHHQAFFVRYTWHTWRLWFLKGAPILMVPHGIDDKPTFMFLRGTVDWDKLVVEACAYRYEKENEEKEKDAVRMFKIIHMRGTANAEPVMFRGKDEKPSVPNQATALSQFNNYEPVGWRIEDIGAERPDDPTDVLAMNDAMLEVERQVEFWKGHEKWYKESDIPWKMGVLLYGPPGTGKTSLVRAIAMKLDMPVYSFDLSTMNSRDFVEAWTNMRSATTKIVLLEDIDTIFHGRENAIQGHRLSFDVLLNTLDGIEQDDGTLLFVTTNRIEQVDPALGRPDEFGDSTRPGRIDLTYEIGKLDHAGRLKLARRILRDEVLAAKMSLDHPNDTPVVFRERCRKLAINMLWGRE